MTTYQISVIVGSLRKNSFNQRLAHAVIKLAPEHFKFHFVEIGDLPLFNQDDDEHQSAAVLRMKREIEKSDGVLFVTPEYNRSIPGVLKNALDHGSRPSSKNSWNKKPAGVMGISPGSIGTSMAQQHLRNILASLNMPTLAQPEAFLVMNDHFFNVDGQFSDRTAPFLKIWVEEFVNWVQSFSTKEST